MIDIVLCLLLISLVLHLRMAWKLAMLEYQHLLMTEMLAIMQDSRDSPVAQAARHLINTRYGLLDRISQAAAERMDL